jgi:diacylglycerol kinase (ATP)
MKGKPSPGRGFYRIRSAFFYSLHGLRSALNEVSFRQEICLFVILLVILFFLPLPAIFKCLLLFANTTVLIVELINSSVESIVDIISPEYHVLAKEAKDLSSAAVLISMILALVLWASAIFFILHRGNA